MPRVLIAAAGLWGAIFPGGTIGMVVFATCRCKKWLDAVFMPPGLTFEADPADLSIVEALETLPLDALAQACGYTRSHS